ncbi:hypothetical protein AWB74_05337 [Caballeronia arvi]|uniref:DUF4238 domain-containing protein n=1 Tax=Caballeronia arvi TaxID=1777135 RepID=A0A158KBC5_9BURK|nr:DUF4238 domain-containing protein [Caballeronia arvi]SAL78387.1 hypothetical protein AWB74_05337 [Caballeronia arvi]
MAKSEIPLPNVLTQRAVLSGPKRQHFLPRFYLEKFSKNGLVAVYDREANAVRLQQPINSAVIGHFYTVTDSDGRRRYDIEFILSHYESRAKPIIDKLEAKKSLDPEERSDFSIFLALCVARTPDTVESVKGLIAELGMDFVKANFNSVDEVWKSLREDPKYVGKSDEQITSEAELMVKMARDGVTIKASHSWAVGGAILMGLKMAPIFAGREWVVVHRPNERKSFITTDAPVLLTTLEPREGNFWGLGFGNADALVTFPLTASCALLMYSNTGKLRHMQADEGQIRQVNLAAAEMCQRFLIGRDAKLVSSLAQAANLSNTKWEPKMTRKSQ